MKRTCWILIITAAVANCIAAAQNQPGRAQSPASQRPPDTVKPQTYPLELVKTGQARFSSECGFCHGRDAAGGETGPDLTRSNLVAEDFRGDKIIPLLRAGRVDKGMPKFDLSQAEFDAIVAFIHDQKSKSETLGGGRRSVEPEDLQTGNAEAGRQYFNGIGKCSTCHSPTGDLAGVATRFSGLTLLQRMLYPPSVRPGPAPAKITVTLPSGESITGSLAARDEFTVAMTDATGMTRTWRVDEVKFSINDPMTAHFDQLGKYTDNDMHNVYAYLETLR
jgi:cytochrome c oxidase cbb3-type subunit 3